MPKNQLAMSSRWRVDLRPRCLMNSWKRASLSEASAFGPPRLLRRAAGDHLAELRLDVHRIQIAAREEVEHGVHQLRELGVRIEQHDLAAVQPARPAVHGVAHLAHELLLTHLQ